MGTKARDRMKLTNPASFLLTRMDALITSVNAMIVRDRGQNPHKIDDPNVVTIVDAYDLASNQTLLNDIKSKYNTHIGSTTYHAAADATNTIVAANQSDQATGQTLANECKTDFPLHSILMTAHITKDDSMFVAPNALPANATDLPTLVALTNALKLAFNRHTARTHIPAVGAISTLDVA